MGQKVLVLNQDNRAISICSAYRAFLLIYMQKAETVIPAKGCYFRTVSKSYPVPSIIRLNKYVHIPYRGVVLTRQNIFKRDNHQCQYCGARTDLTIDHVLPRSRGGITSWDNLVTACKSCNFRKGDFTPEEAHMPLKRKPFKPTFFMFLRDISGVIDEEWMTYLVQNSKNGG